MFRDVPFAVLSIWAYNAIHRVMADTQKLREAVQQFKFYSRPTSGIGNTPATVDDINNLINNIEKLMNTFIEEMER